MCALPKMNVSAEYTKYLSEDDLTELDQLLTAETVSSSDYAAALVILDKRAQIVPYTPNAVQQSFIDNRTGRDLILKARQQGISTAIQADYFTTAVTRTSLQATLAHDADTTQKLRRMADRFYKGLPDHLRPPRGLDNATTTTYRNTGSEVTIATAGSTDVGRGGTYTHVHGSEVAFWRDAAGILAGLIQGVTPDGLIALESTPNGAQGWFYERCMEALDGDTTWKLHFFPWWHDAGYTLPVVEPLVYSDDEARLVEAHGLTAGQIAWRRAKQKELGRLFAQEYPEDPETCFLTSGDGYFDDITDLERVFAAPTNATPTPGHRYVAAFDFAQTNDYCAMSVIDETTKEEVELWRDNKKPWGDMRARCYQTCRKWGVHTLWPEKNSMGSTNIEELHKEFKRQGLETNIQPFDTTAESKPMIVVGFHWAIDEGGLKLLPDPTGRQEIRQYKAKQSPSGAWQYEGKPHDDTVMVRMIAAHAVYNARRGPIKATTKAYGG